jgi:hypothetical protein
MKCLLQTVSNGFGCTCFTSSVWLCVGIRTGFSPVDMNIGLLSYEKPIGESVMNRLIGSNGLLNSMECVSYSTETRMIKI